jgi:hypothetical protein
MPPRSGIRTRYSSCQAAAGLRQDRTATKIVYVYMFMCV